MPAARYWRIVAIDTYAGADLELSALHLYGGAARLDAAAAIASTIAPASGALAALQDDDLASTCRFAGAAVRAGGFAIIWDFGAGNTADVTDLRIAGPLRDAFLARGMLQYSTDGSLWQWQIDVASYDWPGAGAYHNTASAGGDPHYNRVSLLLHFDGANGSTTFVDSSPAPKTVTSVGGAQISAEQSKFGGASVSLNGSTSGLAVNAGDWEFGAQPFCCEAWVYPRIAVTTRMAIVSQFDATARGWALAILGDGKLRGYVGNSTDGEVLVGPGATTVTHGAWHHVALTSDGVTLRIFLDGYLEGSSTLPALGVGNPSTATEIGAEIAGNARFFDGFIDEVRITKGVARYTANFTPPTEPFAGIAVSHLRAPAPDRVRIAAASAVPPHSALSAPPLLLARDMEFGGSGTVYGTVDRKGTPANIPLRRRVRLLSDISGAMVRETWSDATTGAFAFSGIDPTQRYTTIAYDHEHNYRAEAADNLTPEVPT